MLDSLRINQIDVLFHGSIVPETFSYVLYEAIGAGCFILTTNQSGNVADYVQENKNGLVFETFTDLMDYLITPVNLRKDLLDFHKLHPRSFTLEHNDSIANLVKIPDHSGSMK
jgi:glycosyltransferase involved in cell wall biosynthesis